MTIQLSLAAEPFAQIISAYYIGRGDIAVPMLIAKSFEICIFLFSDVLENALLRKAICLKCVLPVFIERLGLNETFLMLSFALIVLRTYRASAAGAGKMGRRYKIL